MLRLGEDPREDGVRLARAVAVQARAVLAQPGPRLSWRGMVRATSAQKRGP